MISHEGLVPSNLWLPYADVHFCLTSASACEPFAVIRHYLPAGVAISLCLMVPNSMCAKRQGKYRGELCPGGIVEKGEPPYDEAKNTNMSMALL